MNILAVCLETLGRHPYELDWLPSDEIPKIAAYLFLKRKAESNRL